MLPSVSNIFRPSFANSSLFLAVALGISLKIWLSFSPASAPLTPLSANADKTATPSSIDLLVTFNADPALLVRASENCCTEAFANVLAFTNTSVVLVKFSKFCKASSLAKPNADWASVARSVAVAISNIPACANFATCGNASIDCSASKPAEAKKKNASADCSAVILDVLETARADSSIRFCCSTVVFIIANDCVIASSKPINCCTASVKPLPIATNPTATPAFIMPESLPNLPVVPSADLPRPDICCFAKSAPLVTILIKISATAII